MSALDQARRLPSFGLLLLIVFVPVLGQAEGAPATTLQVVPGGKLWLEGDSTLHPYSAQATRFDAQLDIDPKADTGLPLEGVVRQGLVNGLSLSIPVTALNSGEKGLDENMVKALKGGQHPNIAFKMDSYQVVSGNSGAMTLKLAGKLTVAGVTRLIEVPVQAAPVAGGLSLTGEVPVLMSNYGVEAPVLMLGMIKTADLVRVKFKLTIQLAK